MKRFSFKFEAILKHRKRREEDCLRALGVAQRAMQAEVERKNELLRALDVSLDRRAGLASSEAIGVVAFKLEDDFIVGTKARIVQADAAILRAKKQVEKAMRVYLMARKQAMVMESLKEKAVADYKREYAKWEQRQMDDMTIMRNRFRGEGEASA